MRNFAIGLLLCLFSAGVAAQTTVYNPGRNITSTGATATQTLADRFAQVMSVKDFGATGNGSTDDLAAWNSAIAWVNTSARRTLRVPGGIYQLSAEPDAITCTDCAFRGDGATVLRFTSGAGSAGTFFTIGSSGTTANRVKVENFRFLYSNTPGAAHPAFAVANANDVAVTGLTMTGVESLVKVGTTTTKGQRVAFRDVTGSYNSALGGNVVWLAYAVEFSASGIVLNGTGTPDAATTSVQIAPVTLGNFIDTVHFDNVEIWTAAQISGVVIDNTIDKVVNVWFNSCVFDTMKNNFTLKATAGAFDMKNIWVAKTRFGKSTPDQLLGQNIIVSNGGTGEWTGINFTDNFMNYNSEKAIAVSGPILNGGLTFSRNMILDTTAVNKPAAVTLASSGVVFSQNRFGRYSTTGNTDYAIQTTADIDNFQLVGNTGANLNTGFVNHFAYAAYSANRITLGNTPGAGTNALDNLTVQNASTAGTGGTGYMELLTQSSAPSSPATNGLRLYSDASGRFSWKGSNGFTRTFDGTANTANRIYVLPDAAGTVALSSSKLSAFAATTSAELAGVLSDESGTGVVCYTVSCSMTTPTLGAATATSINGNTFTTGTYTLTGSAGKTLTFSNSLTLAGTDSTTMTFPSTSASIARTDGTNTFTGLQTLQAGITVNGGTASINANSNNVTNIGTGTTTSQVSIGGGANAVVVNATTTTIQGTTTNLSATTLQRSGNTVLLPRTFTVTYDPASLAIATQRIDTVTVTGITTTGGAVTANAGVDPAAGCIMAGVRASASNTVLVTWQNSNTVGACDTASSTWTFTQAQ